MPPPKGQPATKDLDQAPVAIVGCHEETKHHYHRCVRMPRYTDWENQPNPFRFYDQTSVVELPLLKEDPQTSYPDVFRRENNL